jgi:hypothetical protein
MPSNRQRPPRTSNSKAALLARPVNPDVQAQLKRLRYHTATGQSPTVQPSDPTDNLSSWRSSKAGGTQADRHHAFTQRVPSQVEAKRQSLLLHRIVELALAALCLAALCFWAKATLLGR